MKAPLFRLLPLLCLLAWPLFAADPGQIPRIPPAGITVPDDVRAELTEGAAKLGKEIDSLRASLAARPEMLALLPDVEIFHKAVDWALRYNEFYDVKQFDSARKLLNLGQERAAALKEGHAPWNEQTGLVVRGYRSSIDGSIQPYGLVIPEDWKPSDRTPRRLDFWFHGRGEKLSELSFLDDRLKNKGEFTPAGAIVLHLYGRYCNANKFAGENDLFEAWASANTHYPIDPNRVVVRGFSMGGASTWQFATHHAGLWAAAAPGAGFAETAEFFHSFAPNKDAPPWWEQVLWRWYDSTLYAANLANCPIVAYSGEIDGQRQAANIMDTYMTKEGLTLTQVIGPGTKHAYHPESKPKISEFVDAAAKKGRPEAPQKVHLTTYSLIYPKMRWVTALGLEKQWERADIDAEVKGSEIVVKTTNISALQLTTPFESGLASDKITQVELDGAKLPTAWNKGGLQFQKKNGRWTPGYSNVSGSDRLKDLTLSGPIDHAFMSSFVMVRPTGKPFNDTVGAWVKSEMDHAASFWRDNFRGDAPSKDDVKITAEDVANSNLILWGDPSSNEVLKRIVDKLPLKWTADKLEFAGQTYSSADHAPILIFPNPVNPSHYIVLNSGVTFREYALLNNSDQTPKLPDWAIIDLRTPPGPRWPGLVTDAGFFDAAWKFK